MDLKEAFALFSSESKKLQASYLALQTEWKAWREDLHQIVSHLNEGLIFVTTDGIITIFNTQASKITGVPQQSALKQRYAACFQDELFGFSMSQVLESKVLNKKVFLLLNNNTEIKVSASYLPDRGVVCVLDEKEELEKSVLQNERLKELGAVAATLAHEIRNPLGGIEGFASLLAQDLEKNTSSHHMAEKILEGTRSLNRLVTNILNYTTTPQVHLKEIELVPLIEDVLEYYPETIEFIAPSKVVALCDSDLLKRALFNLIRNAKEASKHGGQVICKVEMCFEEVMISITDCGPGIAPEHLPHIFTPFFTTKEGGSGLGLTEAHKAVALMGGKMVVESTPQKTTFTMRLRGVGGN